MRKIVESLSPPAADLVKVFGPKASPKTYLEHLDSAYATVEDGDELFARFLNKEGEKPSHYLPRLHTVLNLVRKRDGIVSSDVNKQLLRQFCRECWDRSLITNLQLEQKKDNPPHFAELLLQLRTEEDKQASKATCMKQHLALKVGMIMSMKWTTILPTSRSKLLTSGLKSHSSELTRQREDQRNLKRKQKRTQVPKLMTSQNRYHKSLQYQPNPNLDTVSSVGKMVISLAAVVMRQTQH